jgi:hypothetical protein
VSAIQNGTNVPDDRDPKCQYKAGVHMQKKQNLNECGANEAQWKIEGKNDDG